MMKKRRSVGFESGQAIALQFGVLIQPFSRGLPQSHLDRQNAGNAHRRRRSHEIDKREALGRVAQDVLPDRQPQRQPAMTTNILENTADRFATANSDWSRPGSGLMVPTICAAERDVGSAATG